MDTSGLILYNEMDELKECQQKMNDMQIQMNEMHLVLMETMLCLEITHMK